MLLKGPQIPGGGNVHVHLPPNGRIAWRSTGLGLSLLLGVHAFLHFWETELLELSQDLPVQACGAPLSVPAPPSLWRLLQSHTMPPASWTGAPNQGRPALPRSSEPHLCDPMDCSLPASFVHGIPTKNTGVGSHALIQGIFSTQEWTLHLLCLMYWQVGSLPLAPPGKSTFEVFCFFSPLTPFPVLVCLFPPHLIWSRPSNYL